MLLKVTFFCILCCWLTSASSSLLTVNIDFRVNSIIGLFIKSHMHVTVQPFQERDIILLLSCHSRLELNLVSRIVSLWRVHWFFWIRSGVQMMASSKLLTYWDSLCPASTWKSYVRMGMGQMHSKNMYSSLVVKHFYTVTCASIQKITPYKLRFRKGQGRPLCCDGHV